MIELTLAQIAAIVGGRLHNATGEERVTGTVEFDSRRITAGGLFVAIPGERVDGHDFAVSAVRAGATAVLAAREVDTPAVIVPPVQATGTDGLYVLAGDRDGSGAAMLAALGALARYVTALLAAGGLITVGVTGSAGKTSTKDLIAQLLESMGPTVAPPGSFNNELGLPWTALRADERTRYLVLEYSARGIGHIAGLCEIVRPDIGVVLNVGTSHILQFGSQQEIATAKGELIAALQSADTGGVAILNADDPLVTSMAERTAAKVVWFGQSERADVRASDVTLDDQARPTFRLVTAKGEAKVALSLHGAPQVANALAAAAVAMQLGAPMADVVGRLQVAQRRSARRMEVTTRQDGVTVINDSYNASPEAMREALKALATMATATNPARRSWAVLGPMGELGTQSTAIHHEIGQLAVCLSVSRLVVVGEQAKSMHQGASQEGSWGGESVLVPDVDAAIALLRVQVRAGDVVLIKGANVFQLWRVADALLAPVGDAA